MNSCTQYYNVITSLHISDETWYSLLIPDEDDHHLFDRQKRNNHGILFVLYLRNRQTQEFEKYKSAS